MKRTARSKMSVEDAALAFAALGSEQRLAVLQTLVRAGPEGLSVGELGERSGVSGSTLTHHLRFLAHAQLVTQKRTGRTVICAAVAFPMIEGLAQFLVRNCCADTAGGPEGPGPHRH